VSGLSAVLDAVKDARWLEMRDVAEAELALFRAQAMRWVRPLGQLVAVADQPSARLLSTPSTTQREMGERFAKAINRATRYGIFRPKCLARAVALSQMLDAHGIDGHCIRIGVRRVDGNFTAHAWVELGKWILGDSDWSARSYVPLTEARVVRSRNSGPTRLGAHTEPSLPDGQSMWDQ
jgi:hypothetical protein